MVDEAFWNLISIALAGISLAAFVATAIQLSKTIGLAHDPHAEDEVSDLALEAGIIGSSTESSLESKKLRAPDKSLATDVLYMHADDRATIQYDYSPMDLSEGLLLHILYCGRVLVPTNFLLANSRLESLLKVGDRISEESDLCKLIRAGDVVPLLFEGYGGIAEYARAALRRGILLPCTQEQWLERAELLDGSHFLIPSDNDPYVLFREIFIFLSREVESGEGLSRRGHGGVSMAFAGELASRLTSMNRATRSDVYRLIEVARSRKIRSAVTEIADAAYYAAIADSFSANPAVPSTAIKPLLKHYATTEPKAPFLHVPSKRREAIAVMPDMGVLSIAQVMEDLRHDALRTRWLNVYTRWMKRGDADLVEQDIWSSFGRWTERLTEYLSATVPAQPKARIMGKRKVSIESKTHKSDGSVISSAGVQFSAVGRIMRRAGRLADVVFLFSDIDEELQSKKPDDIDTGMRFEYTSAIPVRQ